MLVKFLSNLAQRIPKKNLCIYQPQPRYMSQQENPSDRHRCDATDDVKNFRHFYPEFKNRALHEYSKVMKDDIEIKQMELLMDYHLTTGRQTFTLLMIKFYRLLQKAGEKNAPLENADLFTIAWLLELAIVAQFILDDVFDSSLYRRGSPCWHTLGSNYKYASLDCCKIYLLCFLLCDRYLGDKPYYRPLLQSLYQGHLRTTVALPMDLPSRILQGKAEIPGYYRQFCLLKTGLINEMPFKPAIYLAGYEKELNLEELTKLNNDISYFAQSMNDYADNFQIVHPDGTKIEPMYDDMKIGETDWFLENAMVRASELQKKTIMKHYGRSEDESIQEIVSIYEDLKLRDHFNLFAKELQQNIRKRAKDFPTYLQTFVEEYLLFVNNMRDNPVGKKEVRPALDFGQF